MPRPAVRSILLVVALATAALAASVRASAAPTPEKQAVAVGTGGAVATVDPDATRAAVKILRRGGNAVDAAIAANAVLGVTEPFVAGIGGGGFMVVYLARGDRVLTIDGRETAPQAFPRDAFLDAAGEPIPFFPQRVTSGMAVGVPGTLATWAEAASRFGTMPLRRLLQPAIVVAKRGFVVDETFREQVLANLARLDAFTTSRALFLTPEHEAPAVGSTLRNRELARAYRLIAKRGPSALYEGPIAAAIVDAVRHPPVAPDSALGFPVRPGVMTTADLARYTAPLRAPTHIGYRGYDVYGMPPPSSGGSTVGEALNILEGFDMSTPDRALALHRYLEASKLAFADRNRWIGDPDFVSVPLAQLLSQGFAAERRCLIGDTALPAPVAPGDPFPPYAPCGPGASDSEGAAEGTSTNHLTVVDRYGNVVSYTSTIEQLAGSAIAVPAYGFLLNNELTDFDPEPPFPGVPDPNLPAGGKRPRSSMAPTIVLRDGRPFLGVGSPGGSTIITTVLQILLNRIDFGLSLPDAIAAPRASQRNTPTTVAEPAFISQYGSELEARFGHSFTSTPEIGAATGIEVRPDGRLEAVAEPIRRGGGAADVVCTRAGERRPGKGHGVCAPVPAYAR
ncbi:MAG: gamma-glutamyltransferase [Actinomycetota bacterium]|nr:gamma-glutamyltransferase [Actinomycetota bacterium]